MFSCRNPGCPQKLGEACQNSGPFLQADCLPGTSSVTLHHSKVEGGHWTCTGCISAEKPAAEQWERPEVRSRFQPQFLLRGLLGSDFETGSKDGKLARMWGESLNLSASIFSQSISREWHTTYSWGKPQSAELTCLGNPILAISYTIIPSGPQPRPSKSPFPVLPSAQARELTSHTSGKDETETRNESGWSHHISQAVTAKLICYLEQAISQAFYYLLQVQ